MKRLIILAIMAVVALATPILADTSEVQPPSPTPIIIHGDINMDGRVDACDITKCERIMIGMDKPTPGADVNHDGQVNSIDLTKVERIICRLDY
jgi:hypothetical protein